jgi:endonuclease-8
MPEGPSLFILKEAIIKFKWEKIIQAKGNAKINIGQLKNKKIIGIRTWGKQLLLCFDNFYIRIHLLMFGSYSIDEQTKPDKSLRLGLSFKQDSVFFYNCSVKMITDNWYEMYDEEADVLSDQWNASKAKKKLKAMPGTMVCDALLDQQVFSGVGNIIKSEVLYRIRLHPETFIEYIPPKKLTELIKEGRQYSFDFLHWKKEFVLCKHWLVYAKKTCLRCDLPIIRKQCGKTKRRTFFCSNCQVKYE